MSLSDDLKAKLQADAALAALLTGGIFNDVEEINKQATPGAFDAHGEIRPCALIKLGTEFPLRGYLTSVQTGITIYFYQRSGYATIGQAMERAYGLLNETKTGTQVWSIELVNVVHQQRDTALDCALGALRFTAKRLRS